MKRTLHSTLLLLMAVLFTARVSAQAGTIDPTFNAGGAGPDAAVNTIAVQPDGKLLISGSFTSYNNVATSFTRLNADGTSDPTFQPGSGPNAEVTQVVFQPDGKMIILGGFTEYDGVPKQYSARINADGTLDNSFSSASFKWNNDDINPNSLAVLPNGKIIAGGLFTSVNGTPITNIAMLNSDGSLDLTFNPGLAGIYQNDPYSMVNSVAIQSGKILVGGQDMNNILIGFLRRLNTDGSVDATFNGANTVVKPYFIKVENSGKILVVDDRGNYSGASVPSLVRLTVDGATDAGFNSAPIDGPLALVNLQNDGKIIISGSFTSVAGIAKNGLARLNNDGSFDPNFDFQFPLSPYFQMNTVATGAGNRAFVGGMYFDPNDYTVKGFLVKTLADLPATALNFDGIDDHVTSNNNLPIGGSQPRTVEFNAKCDASGDQKFFFTSGSIGTNGASFGLSSYQGELRFYGWGNAIVDFNTGYFIDNNWHHYAVTYDGAIVRVYVDGTETPVSGKSRSLNTTVTPLTIGQRQDGIYRFNGTMDEFRVWNRALCKGEIVNNMNKELPNVAGQNGLVTYYKFNQGLVERNNSAVTILSDEKAANNATLYGFALDGGNSNWTTSAVTETANMFVLPTLTVTSDGPTFICLPNSSLTLEATVSPATVTPQGIEWYINGSRIAEQDQAIETNTPGNYTAKANIGGCYISSNTLQITGIAPPSASLSGSTQICAGGTANLIITVDGTSPVTGSLFDFSAHEIYFSGSGIITVPVSPENTSTYYIGILSSGGCDVFPNGVNGRATVSVTNIPEVSISNAGSTNTLCPGSTVSLVSSVTSADYTYMWKLNGLILPGAASSTMTANTPGNYSLSISKNGCEKSSNTIALTQGQSRTASIAGSTSICSGGSANLTVTVSGTGAVSGTLSNGQSFSGNAPTVIVPVSPVATKTYTLASLAGNGCAPSLSGSATVTVTTAPAPTITVTRADNTNTCGDVYTIFLGYGGQTRTLTPSGATTYTWATATGLTVGANGVATFTPTTAGSYTFTVTGKNAANCTSTALVTITVVDARCGNGKVVLCHKHDNNLLHDQTLCIDANAVAAHLAKGCKLGACPVPTSRGVMNQEEETELKEFTVRVAPNPSLNYFRVAIEANNLLEKAELRVVDMFGRVVEAKKGLDINKVVTIGGNLQPGNYIVEVIQGGNRKTLKLLKVLK